MKQAKAVFPIFLILLIFSLLILFFFQNPLTAGLQVLTVPVEKWVFGMRARSPEIPWSQKQLEEENNQLHAQLAQMQEVQKDNQALQDQFRTTTPAPQKLLSADVIGAQQNELFIDKGIQDNVHSGESVVVKDNLIGKITKVTPHISQVTLLSDPSTSFTAEALKTSASGIVTAQDGTIIFGNVVLTDKLENNDVIITKGDRDLHGNGYPPNLTVGKIVSVEKQASNLFQSAKMQSLVNISQLRMVFVMTQ